MAEVEPYGGDASFRSPCVASCIHLAIIIGAAREQPVEEARLLQHQLNVRAIGVRLVFPDIRRAPRNVVALVEECMNRLLSMWQPWRSLNDYFVVVNAPVRRRVRRRRQEDLVKLIGCDHARFACSVMAVITLQKVVQIPAAVGAHK